MATGTQLVARWAIGAGIVVVSGMLFLGLELGQLMLPSRVPDQTDVYIGTLGATIGVVLSGRSRIDDQAPPRRGRRDEIPTAVVVGVVRPGSLLCHNDFFCGHYDCDAPAGTGIGGDFHGCQLHSTLPPLTVAQVTGDDCDQPHTDVVVTLTVLYPPSFV